MTRNRVLGLVICLAALTLLFVFLLSQTEPSYNGKTLSEWMDRAAKGPALGARGPTEQELEEAIKHIGSKALPLLVRWIGEDPASLWRTISRIQNALPRSLRTSGIVAWLVRKAADNQMSAQPRAFAAQRALILLGKDARPAVPGLVRILRDPAQGFGAYMAAEVLSRLGREALPEVLKCFTDPSFKNRAILAQVIGRMRGLGEAGAPAVPFLSRWLQQGGPNTATACAEALGNLGIAPEMAVPALSSALTNALQNSDTELSRKCAEALGKFGSRGGEATSGLCAALKSPDGITTEVAAQALGKIGADVAVAVPALIEYLQSQGGKHRKYAVAGLAGYATAASNAIPLVLDALNDADHDTRGAAQEALQRIRPE